MGTGRYSLLQIAVIIVAAKALAEDAAGSSKIATETQQYGNTTVILTYAQSRNISIEVPAGAKFAWCGFGGRDNLFMKVTSNTSMFIAAASPSWITPTECSSKNPGKSCQVFDGTSCDKKTSCETVSWGLLSNHPKCVFAYNAYSTKAAAISITAYSYDAGNWGGIIFGTFIISAAIVGIIGWGCYLDFQKSSFNKHRKDKDHNLREPLREPGSEDAKQLDKEMDGEIRHA